MAYESYKPRGLHKPKGFPIFYKFFRRFTSFSMKVQVGKWASGWGSEGKVVEWEGGEVGLECRKRGKGWEVRG